MSTRERIRRAVYFGAAFCIVVSTISSGAFGEEIQDDPVWFELEEELIPGQEDLADDVVDPAVFTDPAEDYESVPGFFEDPEDMAVFEDSVDQDETGTVCDSENGDWTETVLEEDTEADEELLDFLPDAEGETEYLEDTEALSEAADEEDISDTEIFPDDSQLLQGVNGSYKSLTEMMYTSTKLKSLGCENKLLYIDYSVGIVNIHVNEDITVKGIICANPETSLWIGGSAKLTVASDSAGYYTLDDGTVTAIRAGRITIAEQPAITVSVDKNAGSSGAVMMDVRDEFSISGGTLTMGLAGKSRYGIRAEQDIHIKGGTLKPFGSFVTIESENGSVYIDGGTVDCTSKGGFNDDSGYGIDAKNGNVVINGGTVRTRNGVVGINANKEVLIKAGSVDASALSYGLYGNNIRIEGGSIRSVCTGQGQSQSCGAITASTGGFVMTGGTVTASASSASGNGVHVGYGTEGDLTVSGGTLTAEGGKTGENGDEFAGIQVCGNSTVSGGDIRVTGKKYGMNVLGSSLTMSGGILEISAPAAVLLKKAPSIAASISIMEPAGAKTGTAVVDSASWNSILDQGGKPAQKVLLAKACSVTFNVNGHGKAPAGQTIAAGRCAAKPAAPSAAPFVFDGWYSDAACTKAYNFSTPVTASLTLYASWTGKAAISGEIKPGAPVALSAVEKMILSRTNDKDPKGTSFRLLKAKGTPKNNKAITLTWSKVKGATAYVIYGNKCGKANKYKKLKTVKGTSWTHTKRQKGTYYKYMIVAVQGKAALAVSKTVHVATKGGKKGNQTGLTLNKKTVTLKKGKSLRITAKAQRGSLPVSIHRKIAWETSNPKIAKVGQKGMITALSKGTCYIFAYTQNGISKKVKVTVK